MRYYCYTDVQAQGSFMNYAAKISEFCSLTSYEELYDFSLIFNKR